MKKPDSRALSFENEDVQRLRTRETNTTIRRRPRSTYRRFEVEDWHALKGGEIKIEC